MWLITGENPLRLPRIIILTHAPDLHYYQPKAFPVHFQDRVGIFRVSALKVSSPFVFDSLGKYGEVLTIRGRTHESIADCLS
jgi:hypothetical protein